MSNTSFSPSPAEQWVNAATACRLLSISKSQLDLLVKEGKLVPARLGRKCVRYQVRALCQLMETRTGPMIPLVTR